MSPARFGNLMLALILGTLVGCAFNLLGGCSVDDAGLIAPPDDTCASVALEACLARVAGPDAGAD